MHERFISKLTGNALSFEVHAAKLRADRPTPFQRWASSRCRLDSDLVVYRSSDSLCAAEVALRRLDRDMTEKKLNLL